MSVWWLSWINHEKWLSRKFRESGQGPADIPKNRRLSKSKFARPYILGFTSLSRFAYPSVTPLLHDKLSAASIAGDLAVVH